jgi:hypothetical protein
MEVESAALLGLEPALDGSALVRAAVVQDQVNVQIRGTAFSSPTTSRTFSFELRIVGDLELLHAMRLYVIALPDPFSLLSIFNGAGH